MCHLRLRQRPEPCRGRGPCARAQACRRHDACPSRMHGHGMTHARMNTITSTADAHEHATARRTGTSMPTAAGTATTTATHAAAGAALGAAHAPGLTPSRRVQIEQDILAKNDAIAAANRQRLADRGIFALNLVSSPGSGKTTLLVKTIQALAGPAAGGGDRRRPADHAGRRPHPRHRRAGGAGQYRQGLPPRRRHGAPRAGPARPRRRQPAAHRERRQPGLPGRLRPGRGAQGRHPVGDRGRGQAAEVPRHVPRRRPAAASTRSTCCPMCSSTSTPPSATRAACGPASRCCASRPPPARAWRPGWPGWNAAWPRRVRRATPASRRCAAASPNWKPGSAPTD